jgi:hypothetical protein
MKTPENIIFVYHKDNKTVCFTNPPRNIKRWKHTATLDTVVFLNYLLTLSNKDIIKEINELKGEKQ